MKDFFKYILVGILLPITSSLSPLQGQGLPRIRNYSAAEYGTHNRNFDIEADDDGTVYVANFEGLLYYDRAQWRILHTPDISRVTVVVRTDDKRIWVGGYKFFARLERKANGELYMKPLGKKGLFDGEVLEIFQKDGKVQFVTSDNNIYEVNGDDVKLKKRLKTSMRMGMSTGVINVKALTNDLKDVFMEGILQTEPLSGGMKAMIKTNEGVIITNSKGETLYTITEKEGLCSNQITYLSYDGHGTLWGATAHGIFAIEIPSIYTWLLDKDGMSGEVHAITEYGGVMYIGGSNGLFRLRGHAIERVEKVSSTCWALAESQRGLLVGTASGLWLIDRSGTARQLTTNSAMALLPDGEKTYVAETDGVYLLSSGDKREKISNAEKVIKIVKDAQGTIWMQSVYGEIYKGVQGSKVQGFKGSKGFSTLVDMGGKVVIVGAQDSQPFPCPAYSVTDGNNITWLTDRDGKHLYQWKDGKRYTALDHVLYPIGDMAVGAVYSKDGKVWIGGDEKIAIINTNNLSWASLTAKPRLLFRSIVMGNDSVLWGGYGEMPKVLPQLDSKEHHLKFTYAVSHAPLTGKTLYRYRLNDERWSAWSEKQEVEFLNLPHGDFTLCIQARLANGEMTDVEEVEFQIAPPLLMRWYMGILYLLLAAGAVHLILQYRLKSLNKAKAKLEKLVKDRTKHLERALDELHDAQHELIRQEKMASVGKLTEGLIDRIQNPLNYIINFSKMSIDLLKDIKANIENNKERMDEDDYLDTEDVIGMLTENLNNVDQYGQNTSRTLKAMEEMLKDRTGGYVDMDLLPVLQQNVEMLHTYYNKEIEQHHIKVATSLPDHSMMIHGNPDMLSKTIMSILGNAIYATVKKAAKTSYEPEVTLTVEDSERNITLKIHDNGIGIEDTIINKIFDPFFTTKTTNEAAGVGLYLSREIIQNHGGDITVQSVKDEWTEFIITIWKK